jgi:hypothetical protein
MTRIIRSIFFLDRINLERCIGQIITPFYEHLSDEEKDYGFLQQESGTVHTAYNQWLPYITVLRMQSVVSLYGLLVYQI